MEAPRVHEITSDTRVREFTDKENYMRAEVLVTIQDDTYHRARYNFH